MHTHSEPARLAKSPADYARFKLAGRHIAGIERPDKRFGGKLGYAVVVSRGCHLRIFFVQAPFQPSPSPYMVSREEDDWNFARFANREKIERPPDIGLRCFLLVRFTPVSVRLACQVPDDAGRLNGNLPVKGSDVEDVRAKWRKTPVATSVLDSRLHL